MVNDELKLLCELKQEHIRHRVKASGYCYLILCLESVGDEGLCVVEHKESSDEMHHST